MEASLKQQLDDFISDNSKRQLRDARINQRTERHKQAVQEFLDQYGNRFWPETDGDRSGLLDSAPIFPSDIEPIAKMISNLLAYKLKQYERRNNRVCMELSSCLASYKLT